MTTGEEAGALAVAREWLWNNHTAITNSVYYGRGVPSEVRESLAALITREKNAAVEQERERCASACSDIKEDAEREAIKWHEKRVAKYEARYIHEATGASNCEKAIRSAGKDGSNA